MRDFRWSAMVVLVLALTPSGEPAEAKKKAPQIDDVDDLKIVDCLLPGKIRRLGRRSQYVTARRPVRTTAVDCEIRGGDYVAHDPGSYASALKVWLPAAEAGDPKAQTYVGEIFEKGLAGTPDHESAAVWYRRAAEQGFSRAQINLAQLYEEGLGVAEDKEEALVWYRKAAGITEDMVLDSRAEAAALRRELERATSEAAELQQKLEEAKSNLEESRSQLESFRSEMEDLRRKLQKAQASSMASADVERLATEIRRRETEVAQRTREVDQQAEDVANRKRAFEAFRQQVEEIRGAARRRGSPGPTIEIVRPDILATRGPALVPIPAGVSELEITGRVTAPAGLAGLTVDDRPLNVEANGLFSTRVACSDSVRKEILFEVRDRGGETARTALVLVPATTAAAHTGEGERREEPIPGKRAPAPATEHARAERSVALILGVAQYTHFPALETATADAEGLGRLLSDKYGFSTKTLKNPTSLAILLELKALSESLGPNDDLLIYYAGHGKIDSDTRRGFWIPADAERDDPGKWIPNETITDYLDLIPARRILVVSDSCYAGTMTRSGLAQLGTERSAGSRREPSPAASDKRTRTVLTSGGLQPVLDVGGGEHSIFSRALLTVLKLNDEPLPGADLHREVAARVTFAASELGVDQIPHYAPIQFSGHETGDFVLTPRRTRSSRSPASP